MGAELCCCQNLRIILVAVRTTEFTLEQQTSQISYSTGIPAKWNLCIWWWKYFWFPCEHWVQAPSWAVSSQSAPVVSPHSAPFPATVSEDGAVGCVRPELSEGFKAWPTKTVFRNTTWSWLSPSFLSRAGWDCQAIHQAVPTELAPLPGSKSSGKLVVVGIKLVPGEIPLPFPSSHQLWENEGPLLY